MGRFLTIIIVAILLIGGGIFYWRYFWVFGEGVKSGELNYVVRKGYIFKTYEGKLIQSGFKGGMAGSIQSYEFEFSVGDKRIAEELMTNSGKEFELHYKEYLGALPWRGNTKYVVDSILSMKGDPGDKQISPRQ
ncbi:hypothetical protein [Flavihumibacter sp. ZG627]|uniref:hypothetical protein n=1 Tax=Flavihumibacter sp. ZG627 TaxID=1463156 RepID=UPI00057EA8F5|nr:hypothetical protein [Flavihumibacter sp. ZG627]KIC90625.1 hypothetical protein HY58_11830 [Flavihumibacter sp. ZG627]